MKFNIKDRELTVEQYANPYECDGMYHNPTGFYFVSQSDYDFANRFIVAYRATHHNAAQELYQSVYDNMALSKEQRQELELEISSFDQMTWNRIHILTSPFNIFIPDEKLVDDTRLFEYCKEQHKIIIGPKIDPDGNYLEREGTWREALDIFGNKITEYDQKYKQDNKFTINDEVIVYRTVFVRDSENYYDTIHLKILPKKVKHLISIPDEESEIDGLDLRFEGEGEPQDVVFVRDVSDDVSVIAEIKKYMAEKENIWDDDIILKIDENHHFQKIPYKNAIRFSIVCASH